MSSFIAVDTVTTKRIEKYSPPDTLVKGNPHQVVELYLDLPQEGVKAGYWSGEVGAYRLEFGPQKVEHFLVMEGHLRVHNDDGSYADFKPGDTCVLPGGFSGIFEILSPAKKQFVIKE